MVLGSISMKAYDFNACVLDCEIFCNECLPVDVNSHGVEPIFADSEWDCYPTCCTCGMVHDYVNLTLEGDRR